MTSMKITLAPGLRFRASSVAADGAASLGWRAVILLVSVAALLFQATVIQAHVHPARFAPAAGLTADRPASIEAAGRTDMLADCQLCVEAALSGHYLLASANAAPLPPEPILGVDPQSLPEFRLLSRTHGWLSRAPPQ